MMCKCNDCDDVVKSTCWCQNKKTPHVHAELIKAWADGAEIQFCNNRGIWTSVNNPSFYADKKYRIKPQAPQEPVYAMVAYKAWDNTNLWDGVANAVLKAKYDYDKALKEYNND